MQSVIAYYRVSTKRQGESGLGLSAQRAAVEAYCKATGAAVVEEFTEVESGKRKDRPELRRALQKAKRSRAVLVVAKLDRLARNVAFLSALMESEAEFVAVDNPTANRLTLHILSAVAEDEARRISDRTRQALAACDKPLGSARKGHWDGREDRRRAGAAKGAERAAEVHRERADADYADVLPTIVGLREKGETLDGIARQLNATGELTRRGKPWNKVQVSRVLARAEGSN